MAYTPELSAQHSAILRRLAWATGRPMTDTLKMIMEFAAEKEDKKTVCENCRDKSKCRICPFTH